MSLRLPVRPHLALVKRHAKEALRVGRMHHPQWLLADAQHALARGHGFANWAALKREVARHAPMTSGDTVPPSVAPIAPPSPLPLAGDWVGTSADTVRVSLSIAGTTALVILTQVITSADGSAIANSLAIRPDGRAHRLDVGEDLTIHASWTDARTLKTTVYRHSLAIVDGVYAVTDDGQALAVTTADGQRFFRRAEPPPVVRRERRARLMALVAGALLLFGGLGCATAASRRAADRRAIEALNQHDIAAGLASDLNAVVAQWSDDFTLLPAKGEVIRGKADNARLVEQARPQLQTFEPVSYDVTFEEIVVDDHYAFAWGSFRSAARVRASGKTLESSGKLLRIYQRQPDGGWLMHRTMSTLD